MDEYNIPLRKRYDAIDAKTLEDMARRQDEEDSTLDFKRFNPRGEPDKGDIDNLRKVICGFANTTGGIVLWGVESKNVDGKETSRFERLVPIQNVDSAVARLRELTVSATSPPVSGVVHSPIAIDGGAVIKTFVPASESAPHRENTERGLYYRRYADSFRQMSHVELIDLLSRKTRPRLAFWHEMTQHQSPPPDLAGQLYVLGLVNVGQVVAEQACLRLVFDPKRQSPRIVPFDRRGTFGLTERPTPQTFPVQRRFVGEPAQIVYPRERFPVLIICAGGTMHWPRVEYGIYARDMLPVTGSFMIGPHELKDEDPNTTRIQYL